MAISPYDLEQKFDHELDVLEGEIDERLIEEAKTMTTEELLKRMNEDKNFADIILNDKE